MILRVAQLFVFTAVVLAHSLAWAKPPVFVAGEHVGELHRDRVSWTSTYLVTPTNAAGHVLRFAAPIPKLAEVRALDGARVVRGDEGSVVGAEIDPFVNWVTIETSIPRGSAADPPFAPDVPQQVELAGAEVQIPSGSPLELRLTDIRHRSLTDAQVEMLEQRFGDGEVVTRPIRLDPDAAFWAAGGLDAHIVPTEVARRGRLFGIAGLFALLIVVALVVLRLVARAAKAEEAEAFLRDFELEGGSTESIIG